MNTPAESLPVDLPDGWIHITMDAAVESMKNGLYKPANEYAERGVACLRMYNIDDGKIVWKSIKRMLLTPDEVNEYHLAPGDLLVNRVNSRELVGKAAVFPTGLEDCVYESKNIRVRLLSGLVNSDFANYQFLLFGQNHFNYNSQQVVGMASISQPQIAGLPLLLPPRIEQERIVSKVRRLLAEVDKTHARIANAKTILKRFRQAVLAAACSGKLTEDWRESHADEESVVSLRQRIATERVSRWESAQFTRPRKRRYPEPVPLDEAELPGVPEVWTWVSADEVCSQITDGEHIQPRYKLAGLPMITATHVRDGFVEFKDVGLISEEDFRKCLKRCAPAKDDILIVSVGATTGRVAIVPECQPFAMVRSVLAQLSQFEAIEPSKCFKFNEGY
jgi:type I restriction enzyme S subunit